MTQPKNTVELRPRLPEWLKVQMPGSPRYMQLKQLMRSQELHTVCEEAHCPNIGECWSRGTATFMILGDICTRRCHYCAVTTGRPLGIDLMEPKRLADTVRDMNLRYCVITSVNRDDLPDGGAYIFAACINRIREVLPECRVEVLIPDFAGNWDALQRVIEAGPAVLNHNIESTVRVFPRVRPKGNYNLSLELLAKAKEIDAATVTKSGIIVGMGETTDEVLDTMRDLQGCGLRPAHHRPVPAPVGQAHRHRPFLPPRRVRGAAARWPCDGIQARGFRPAGPQLLPRRRTARRGLCAVAGNSE